MKKYLPYILILVALIGLFNPFGKAHAQEATGTCSYYIPGIEGEKTKIGTKAECDTLSGDWLGLGTCTIKFVFKENQVNKDVTERSCRAIPGTWVPNTTTPEIPTPTPEINTDTTYTPLAPLPGLGTIETDPGCTTDANGVKTCTNPCVFGKYMNIMINLLIGIAAVLAVLMIVIGGLEYMTSELISSKEHGKDRINNAILGLVIALGSWALLNTLNPKLLDVCLDDLPEARITIMDEGPESPEDAAQDDASAPTGPAPLCPEGIQRTRSGMFACGSIAQKLDGMIDAARNAGLNITGGGYRTVEAQRVLRIKNCNGNETDRKATCNPPTAIPGASRHNNGLAFDLKCEGSLIRNNTNACFVWLKTNARTFGFSNLKSEQWHWSTDGK
ncbi:MAG: D-alanyl-D-alanine carboxypeptidase family protein [Candidatus Parcubacteria bacterium]|nr:D-alanyl-D-alanine carboxypeptidase family protein [Candidatus Parcubacteria bacterium]